MIEVFVFLGGLVLFMGVFLFLMMWAIKTEQEYVGHLKSNYPAVYDDNPYALGGALEHKVMRKRVLRCVIFTRAKSVDAKAQYKLAKRDKAVQRLKRRAWIIGILLPLIILISFYFLLSLIMFFASN